MEAERSLRSRDGQSLVWLAGGPGCRARGSLREAGLHPAEPQRPVLKAVSALQLGAKAVRNSTKTRRKKEQLKVMDQLIFRETDRSVTLCLLEGT